MPLIMQDFEFDEFTVYQNTNETRIWAGRRQTVDGSVSGDQCRYQTLFTDFGETGSYFYEVSRWTDGFKVTTNCNVGGRQLVNSVSHEASGPNRPLLYTVYTAIAGALG